ncbi:MAG: LysM peptidoglycan-binding domain-containing protein [Anaerolineae bacterium]
MHSFAIRLPRLSLRWRVALATLAFILALGFLPASIFADPLEATTCSHLVQRGDTLYAIAAKYGTTVAALVSANNITNPGLIWAGVTLKLPGCGATSTAPARPAAPTQPAAPAQPIKSAVPNGCFTCTISAGQSIAWLADDYGSSVAEIMARNNLTSTTVYPGQRLIVCPTGGKH